MPPLRMSPSSHMRRARAPFVREEDAWSARERRRESMARMTRVWRCAGGARSSNGRGEEGGERACGGGAGPTLWGFRWRRFRATNSAQGPPSRWTATSTRRAPAPLSLPCSPCSFWRCFIGVARGALR
eukprot:2601025-Rhodomonas_salina.2